MNRNHESPDSCKECKKERTALLTTAKAGCISHYSVCLSCPHIQVDPSSHYSEKTSAVALLEKKLSDALKAEEYEQAARIRDSIQVILKTNETDH